MEILRPHTKIGVVALHPDDTENLAGAQIWEESRLGHTIETVMLTRGDAQGIAETRRREQLASQPHLGISRTHFLGHELGIRDSIEMPDAATQEQTLGLMVEGLLWVVEEAEAQGEPFDVLWGFGEDGLTGHWQHRLGKRVMDQVAEKRREIQQKVTTAWSPDQRNDFLGSYNGIYAEREELHVPVVDVSDYLAIPASHDGLRHKVAGTMAHRSQMAQDGERAIRRWTNERPHMEYVKVETRGADGLFAPRGNIFSLSNSNSR